MMRCRCTRIFFKIQHHTMQRFSNSAATIFGVCFSYYLLFQLNDKLFSFTEFTSGVNLIYLPAGLHLLHVLIFGRDGAIGIGISSAILDYGTHTESALFLGAMNGLITGTTAYFTRVICIQHLGMSPNLSGLTAAALLKISVIFAIFSPTMHQLWRSSYDPESNFITNTTMMMLGDLTGTLLLLFAARYVIYWVESRLL